MISKFDNLSSINRFLGAIAKHRFWGISFLCTLAVWMIWLTALGPIYALQNLVENWEIALTMTFGSMVAGGTSMGGGAVAFPVLTKVLQVPPQEAKVFSLAIQSVGMGAATLTIIAMKTPVEWRLIRWVTLGGIPGIFLGTVVLAPLLPPAVIKISFTMMLASFGAMLLASHRTGAGRNLRVPSWGGQERAIALCVGVVGGTISGLVGSGMDVFAFSVMVLLFGLCETVGTPTSVILMAFNAWAGFFIHRFILGDFVAPVTHYWLAAVPVVVVGAPAGAILCSYLRRRAIVSILLGLIFVESVSSPILIPLTPAAIISGLSAFALFTSIYYWLHRICPQTPEKCRRPHRLRRKLPVGEYREWGMGNRE